MAYYLGVIKLRLTFRCEARLRAPLGLQESRTKAGLYTRPQEWQT